MKRLCLVLFLAGSFLGAQTITQSSSASTTGDKTDLSNMGANPVIAWRLTFWLGTGLTAATVQLDCAPDNAGVHGSYAACTGVADGTTNPVTVSSSPLSGTIFLKQYTPHIAVNITSLTGAGTLHWVLTGLWGSNTAPTTVTSSGGGGGGTTPVKSNCTGFTEVTLSGTSYTTVVAASGSTVISVCNVGYTSASGGVPGVNTFTMAFGTCAGAPTEALSLAGITGYTDQFFGSLAGTAGQALCAKEATGNSDKVWVSFLQQ